MVGAGLEAGPHVVLGHARQAVHGQGHQLEQEEQVQGEEPSTADTITQVIKQVTFN